MMVNTTAVHNNRVVLITGGTRGIGRALVDEFALLGYTLAINYNSSVDRAKLLSDELKSKGIEHIMIKADISIEEEVEGMVKTIMGKYGRIDVLVNNSAYYKDAIFYDKTVEDFEKTMKVNVVGTFIVSRLVGEIMSNAKYGRIINLSSTNGINTYFPMCIDYDASKSAIISLTHNLAVQFAPYVTVNAVAPGFIATESEMEGMDEEFIRLEEEKIMVRRVGEPKEVAKLISFLASDDAGFINNQVIRINGGIYGDC